MNPWDRIFKNEKFLNCHDNPVAPFPFYVDVELTNRCNLSCKMCSRQIMTRPTGNMVLETAFHIIEEAAHYGAGIRFARWGEPLLYPYLEEVLLECREFNVPTFLSTNGVLISEMLHLIYIPDIVRISLQGYDSKTYETIRGKDLYGVLIKNALLVGTYLIVFTTVEPDTAPELIQQFRDDWRLIADKVEVGITNWAWIRDQPDVEKHYSRCFEVWTKLSVNWNGDITACCSDYDGELIVGNMANMTLKEAWESKALRSLRVLDIADRIHNIPHCSKCYRVVEKFKRECQ